MNKEELDYKKLNIIKCHVANYYGLDLNAITERTRKKTVLIARQVAMNITRVLTKLSYANIGQELGGYDHATVMNAMTRIQDKLDLEPQFSKNYDELFKRCKIACLDLENGKSEHLAPVINFDNCISITDNQNRSIVFTEYTMDEVIEFMKKLDINRFAKQHKNTGAFILR